MELIQTDVTEQRTEGTLFGEGKQEEKNSWLNKFHNVHFRLIGWSGLIGSDLLLYYDIISVVVLYITSKVGPVG